ncbi:hypothetical protein T07_12572 [Trichinella nelsoni]|uniref:Uncharacterized protein n=1 Tax=Trichinella nelsoni TaxID=6336 RepID=A0A0V0S173_9BILA|nr:hypothetical protein T07_12572 [Trichinella nelsoni]
MAFLGICRSEMIREIREICPWGSRLRISRDFPNQMSRLPIYKDVHSGSFGSQLFNYYWADITQSYNVIVINHCECMKKANFENKKASLELKKFHNFGVKPYTPKMDFIGISRSKTISGVQQTCAGGSRSPIS